MAIIERPIFAKHRTIYGDGEWTMVQWIFIVIIICAIIIIWPFMNNKIVTESMTVAIFSLVIVFIASVISINLALIVATMIIIYLMIVIVIMSYTMVNSNNDASLITPLLISVVSDIVAIIGVYVVVMIIPTKV